jgi:hypothetical protein
MYAQPFLSRLRYPIWPESPHRGYLAAIFRLEK